VTCINTNNTVRAPIKVGGKPTSVAISPNGVFAYVTNYDDGTVLGALLGEDVGVTLVADVGVGRRPRPGVRGGALVVVLAA
jgi:DNA-binding beta-propeller fold protein YncE